MNFLGLGYGAYLAIYELLVADEFSNLEKWKKGN